MASGALSSSAINGNPISAALAPDSTIPYHRSLKRPWNNIFSIHREGHDQEAPDDQLDLLMISKFNMDHTQNRPQRSSVASSNDSDAAASRIKDSKTLDLFGVGDQNNSMRSTLMSSQPRNSNPPAGPASLQNLLWTRIGNIMANQGVHVQGHDACDKDTSSTSTLQDQTFQGCNLFPIHSQSELNTVESKAVTQSQGSSMIFSGSPQLCKEQLLRLDDMLPHVSDINDDITTSCFGPYNLSKKQKTSYSTILEAALQLDLNLSPLLSANNNAHHSVNGCIKTSVDHHRMMLPNTRLQSQSALHVPPNLHAADQINLYESNNNNMVIVGCPCCLMYVMLCAYEPKCPKCGSEVIDTNFPNDAIPKKLIAHDLF